MQRENENHDQNRGAGEPELLPLGPDDRFRFGCGPQVGCFNACCGDLNQFLTPYDILRMKNSLGMSSTEFLSAYTSRHVGPETGMPVVTLRPSGLDGMACPFLTAGGCGVYADRPGSCRTYPLVRLSGRNRRTGQLREQYYLMREAHCAGHDEDREWTVEQWVKNQGLAPYNRANDLFMQLIAAKNAGGGGPLSLAHQILFEMACYDLDRFRERLSQGDLACLDEFPNKAVQRALEDDEVLMHFGVRWLLLAVFGVRT
ncbi:MAG: YkgJ family cysteine cluster protein [Desulfatibacillaceae bacterium]